jgi:hypothetical protein
MKKNILLSALISFLFILSVNGKENISDKKIPRNNIIQLANCSPSTAHADLDIGNVRCPIWINGDMWWDLVGNALYEIPKNSGKKSLFAGAFWIGGEDQGGNLRVAAQTYRQSGSDFWPGPVDTTNASTDAFRCQNYDRVWKITRQEVMDYLNGAAASASIINWPGNGNTLSNESQFLAPFYDMNADGLYNILDGDYPKYDFGTVTPGVSNRLNGDQTIWWVFNDVGNVHAETGSLFSLGIEVRAQAYAFCSTDADLSNTTFYSYTIINRATTTLVNTYIGHWVDADLGNYLDDYVGCDVGRNLGYCYNGDDLDEGATGYGTNIPAVGMDILGGPLADAVDSIDNDRNGVIDEPGEEILMSRFLYYNNIASSFSGNPTNAIEHYNYLKGIWKDNSPLYYGGNGYQQSGAPVCDFMFPGNSDPLHWGTDDVDPGFDWSERNPCLTCAPNAPGDRRFLMSSGEFRFLPGQVVNFTKAALWARSSLGTDSAIEDLKRADDKIQNFFDSDFTNVTTCFNTVGIDKLTKTDFTVYPSPARDYFTINFKKEINNLKFEIYSSDGKLIYNTKDTNVNTLSINSSGWKSGIYYYIIYDDNLSKITGKLIIL